MARWVVVLAVFASACADDDAWKGFDFRLDTERAGSKPNTGIYYWGDHDNEASSCPETLLSNQPCRPSGSRLDEPNPDVEGMAGGAEEGVYTVRVFLLDMQGPECVLTRALSEDVCDRDGVPYVVRLTPL